MSVVVKTKKKVEIEEADSIVRSIPVKTPDGEVLFYYDLGNLFSRHGNDDGDNYALVELAYKIMERIEKETGLECETPNTIHNTGAIDRILDKNGKIVWENKWDVWSNDPDYVKLWNSLPGSVKNVLRKLAEEGIEVTDIFGV